ncbi:hypothetical protein SprV_0401473600 [Sparganum proliferum]
MTARVTDSGAVSEAFAVTNGVKQGCVLAPTLFSLMFSAMLMDAYRDERPGLRIVYRTDGRLLNQRRMHFQSRVSTTTVHELLFADDCALNTTSEEDMQQSMNSSPPPARTSVWSSTRRRRWSCINRHPTQPLLPPTTCLRRRRHGFSPPRRPNSPIQGYFEVLPEASAD